MKGTNKVRGVEPDANGLTVQVHEIFATIQGEGPFSGERATFIRLTGCCLRCWWCDTEWNDEDDPRRAVATIALEAWNAFDETSPARLAVVTGGEPTNWPLTPLCEALRRVGFERVQIETAGVRYDPAFALDYVTVVCSPKTPNIEEKLHRLENVFFKYPLLRGHLDEHDGLPVTNTQIRQGRVRPLARPSWLESEPHRVFVTPLEIGDPLVDAESRAVVGEIAMKHGYIAQLQIHKFMRLP